MGEWSLEIEHFGKGGLDPNLCFICQSSPALLSKLPPLLSPTCSLAVSSLESELASSPARCLSGKESASTLRVVV